MTDLDPADWTVRPLGWTARTGVRFTRALAFWIGIALPICYLPLIVGGFIVVDFSTFVALIAVNYLALLAGAGYGHAS